MARQRGGDGLDSLGAVPGYEAGDEEGAQGEEEGFETVGREGLVCISKILGGHETYVERLTIVVAGKKRELLFDHGDMFVMYGSLVERNIKDTFVSAARVPASVRACRPERLSRWASEPLHIHPYGLNSRLEVFPNITSIINSLLLEKHYIPSINRCESVDLLICSFTLFRYLCISHDSQVQGCIFHVLQRRR